MTDLERAVKVCPQCEGEGGYPDGLDEAACHTDCTRCGGNGWIIDLAALTPADSLAERRIVAWLRKQGSHYAASAFHALPWTPQRFADAIERGDHLKETGE